MSITSPKGPNLHSRVIQAKKKKQIKQKTKKTGKTMPKTNNIRMAKSFISQKY